MGKVMVARKDKFNRAMINALRLGGASQITFTIAQGVQDAALVKASTHHVTGNYARSIRVEKRGPLDHTVVATDKNAYQIEFGHFTPERKPEGADKKKVETDKGKRKKQPGASTAVGAHEPPRPAQYVEGRRWVDGLHIMRETARLFGGDEAVETPRKGAGRLL